MVKAYVMAQLVPNKARDGYEMRRIGIYSESTPTSMIGDVFALLYESEGRTFGEAMESARINSFVRAGSILAKLLGGPESYEAWLEAVSRAR